MYASAAGADAVRQWQAGATGTISGGKKAQIYDRGAGRVHISQNGDERKEAVVARRGSSDCQQAWQEGQDHRVRRACRGRDQADAAVWKV